MSCPAPVPAANAAQHTADPKAKKPDTRSKRSRVIAMLQSPPGATIAAGRCLPVNNVGPKYTSRRSLNSRLGSVAVAAASAGAAHLTTFRQRLDFIANEPAATLCKSRMFPSSRGFSRPNPQTAPIPKSFRYFFARSIRRWAPSRPSCVWIRARHSLEAISCHRDVAVASGRNDCRRAMSAR